MTAYAETQTTTAPAARPIGFAAYAWHGARAGILGAATIAVWFLYVDFAHGRPFYTPTLLGSRLVGGGGVVPPAVTFSVVHAATFIVVGIAAARLVGVLEERGTSRLGFAALLLFIVLDLGFAAFALSARAIGLEALSWTDVLLGNAIAAAVMMTHLWRARPHVS